MKKRIGLSVFLAALCVPLLLADPELRLTSGVSTITITDGSVQDSCIATDCVTYNGAIGGWNINVSTGLEGTTPFVELNSIDSTKAQISPISILFSDSGLTFTEPELRMDVGGTIDSSKPASEVMTFGMWTGTGFFGETHQVGSILTFARSPFSGTVIGSIPAGDSSFTAEAAIYLGSGAQGAGSFDATLNTVPEPSSIVLLGLGLVVFGTLRRRLT